MSEVKVKRTITIEAETIGDVAKWLNALGDLPMSTELVEPVDLAVDADE